MIFTESGSYTKQILFHDIRQSIESLSFHSISSGDRVVISAENSYEFIVTLFSLIHLDCSIILLDGQVGEQKIKRVMEETNAKICLIDRDLPIVNTISIKPLASPDEISYIEFKLNIEKWKSRKDALILYTSGSTGQSKAIIKSGQSMFINLESTMKSMCYLRNDILLPVIPFSHFYGLSLLFIWWMMDCHLVLCDYKKVRKILKAISDYKVTVVDAIPSTYHVLIQLMEKRQEVRNDLKRSSVRLWCIGGSPLSAKLAADFEGYVGRPLLDGYGLSEAGNIALNTGNEKGCGKALESVRIMIMDEYGKEAQAGNIGEVLIKSPGLMEGYLGLKKETERAFLDGWYRTSDLGYMTPDQHLYVVGRKGEGFLRKGYLIYPATIEKEIFDSLGYRGKVFSFKDEKKDSYVLIFIEEDPANIAEIKRNIYTHIDPFYQPNKILVLKEFPYLLNGKVDQVGLQKLASQWNQNREEDSNCIALS
ncbi:class I adenylate-forming enzyme family protein [Cytobacillus kochii]|uniref:class I adenylate-forming enzyme family protein n=1 Tax=Cytobacillus kochii TaxID=859143 RepID=UPI0025A1C0F9|nr:class I adenylate-forming enzyme family protein [Cytobacillus kochii]MDM5209647.1 class I adenylate-forming enzyme family protein [Cytobacillus kochii]